MHSPEIISGNDCQTVWTDSATNHVTFSGESGYLLSTPQVPEPQRSVPRSRDGTAAGGRPRRGADRIRMAFERADRLAAPPINQQSPCVSVLSACVILCAL